jgi:hypothetical protein
MSKIIEFWNGLKRTVKIFLSGVAIILVFVLVNNLIS